jgi:hypothetical protein
MTARIRPKPKELLSACMSMGNKQQFSENLGSFVEVSCHYEHRYGNDTMLHLQSIIQLLTDFVKINPLGAQKQRNNGFR